MVMNPADLLWPPYMSVPRVSTIADFSLNHELACSGSDAELTAETRGVCLDHLSTPLKSTRRAMPVAKPVANGSPDICLVLDSGCCQFVVSSAWLSLLPLVVRCLVESLSIAVGRATREVSSVAEIWLMMELFFI